MGVARKFQSESVENILHRQSQAKEHFIGINIYIYIYSFLHLMVTLSIGLNENTMDSIFILQSKHIHFKPLPLINPPGRGIPRVGIVAAT